MITLLLGFSVALVGFTPVVHAAAPGATLEFASGPVTVDGKSGPHAGTKGEPLVSGDSVATGVGATAVVALVDGSKLKLRASSRLVLALPDEKNSLTDILLEFGSLFAKVTRRLARSQFRVRTPTAVAAVRGTQFFTAYGRAHGKDSDVWVCVNEGVVDVNTTAAEKMLAVPAGKGVLIKGGKDLTAPQAYAWTKKLNWNMDAAAGAVEDKTNLDAAYSDLLDQDYH
jgi:ferric-dicitrate binding protein FerR (iron transport regulator)